MSEQKHNLSGDEIADKAGDLARSNPDAARSVIDKVEDAVDTATGGRFSDAVDKAGDMLEEKLGLPNNQGGTEPAPTDPAPVPTEPAPTDPGTPTEPAPVPTEPTVPFPDTEPAQPGRAPASDGEFAPPREDGRE